MLEKRWEQLRVARLKGLLAKFPAPSDDDVEYLECCVLFDEVRNGTAKFRVPALQLEAHFLLAQFDFLHNKKIEVEQAVANYKKGDLRFGLLLLLKNIEHGTPPNFSRMEQVYLTSALAAHPDPFIKKLRIRVLGQIPQITSDERSKVLVNPDEQYQWIESRFLNTSPEEPVHQLFERFLLPEHFSELLKSILSRETNAFLNCVKPTGAALTPQLQEEWELFKIYVKSNMGDAVALENVFLPLLLTLLGKMQLRDEQKANLLMHTMQQIPDSVFPRLQDRIAFFKRLIPDDGLLLSFHHIQYRPEYVHLSPQSQHKESAAELLAFIQSPSCTLFNYILHTGLFLVDEFTTEDPNLNRMLFDLMKQDYPLAIIRIYETLLGHIPKAELKILHEVIANVELNKNPLEVLCIFEYVRSQKKIHQDISTGDIIKGMPIQLASDLRLLEQITPQHKLFLALYIKAKQFERASMLHIEETPEQTAAQVDLQRVFQTFVAGEYIDKYLDISRISRVAQKMLQRPVHAHHEVVDAIDEIYTLKNREMLVLYQVFMTISFVYRQRDVELRSDADGVQFKKLRDELSAILQKIDEAGPSVFSVNPGIIRTNQPLFGAWRFASGLRNRVVDINASMDVPEGFSNEPGNGPLAGSISGHAYFLIAALIHVYRTKVSLETEVFQDLTHFLRVAVSFYVIQGYHSFPEMLVPMLHDPMIQRALRGQPLLTKEERQQLQNDIELGSDEELSDDDAESEEEDIPQSLAELFDSANIALPVDVLVLGMRTVAELEKLYRQRQTMQEQLLTQTSESRLDSP
jgi:hypothetical protein